MPTLSPNIGLQIPDFNQANWQVPLNYDWNLLDLIFGGAVVVPALTVTTLTATTIIGAVLPPVHTEIPAATTPGTVYTLSQLPNALILVSSNGVIQRSGTDFTLSGQTITFATSQGSGAQIYAVYF